MKNKAYILFFFFWIFSVSHAQIAVAKTNVNGSSTLLDFEDSASNTRAIILPAVNSAPTGLTSNNNGTFIFDKSDLKLKMFENGMWKNLSDAGNAAGATSNSGSELGQGITIGAPFSNAKGVLVLESSDKAMILPKISNPHINVKSPHVGTMCYDTVSKSLAVFDGLKWNYWK